MIKKLFTWLIQRYRLHQVIYSLQNNDTIKVCNEKVVNNGGTFLLGSFVDNQQNDRQKIKIGSGTLVAGVLMVFKYGGFISIGQNCYIGDHSRIWSGESVIIGDHVFVSHNVNIMDTNSHEINAFERQESYKKLLEHGLSSEK